MKRQTERSRSDIKLGVDTQDFRQKSQKMTFVSIFFHLKELAVGIKHLRHKNATPIWLGGPRVEKETCPLQ